MISVTRRLEFDAGHRIPDHRSQCRNLHGHRYVLEITLTGDVVQAPGESDNGMLMDFSEIKHIAKTHIVDVWDHAFLVYEGAAAAPVLAATRPPWLPVFHRRKTRPLFSRLRKSMEIIAIFNY
jgi:6-pyruvoyltetrahydropterin/6-carboxytetrahydropterin synthase